MKIVITYTEHARCVDFKQVDGEIANPILWYGILAAAEQSGPGTIQLRQTTGDPPRLEIELDDRFNVKTVRSTPDMSTVAFLGSLAEVRRSIDMMRARRGE